MMKINLDKKIHKQDIIFKALGGVSEVGATSYFIIWKGIRILVDAGKRHNGKKLTPEYDEIGKDIDILFITHIHIDHIGSIMEYYDYFNIGKIVATSETKASLEPILFDAKKFADRKEFYENRVIHDFLSCVRIYDYNNKYSVKKNQPLRFTMVKTSHLIGSAGILLEDEDYKLFITSDFTESEKFFHPQTYFEPVYDQNIDTVVTETTYGSNEDSDLVTKEYTLSNLELYINKVFQETGGNVFIPAFSSGRTQEIILALLKLIKENRLPFTTKVLVPFRFKGRPNLAQRMTKRYFKKYTNILEKEIDEKIRGGFEDFVKNYLKTINLGENSEEFFDNSEQILISSPGMLGSYFRKKYCDGNIAPQMQLALDILESKRHGIIFAGYQSPSTLGGKIQSLSYGNTLRYMSKDYRRNTPHIYKVTFPGHVSANGLLSLVKKVRPNNVILTHGEIKSSRIIARAIKDRDINVIIPDIEEDIFLMDNNIKRFFSCHHKYSNILLALDEKISEENISGFDYILDNKKFAKLKIIKTVKHIIKHYDKRLNHIEIVFREGNLADIFINILENELGRLGYTTDFISIDTSTDDRVLLYKEILEQISETALGFREKFRIFFLIDELFYTQPYNIVAQFLNEELYYLDESQRIIKLPNLPVDIDTKKYKPPEEIKKAKKKSLYTEQGHGDGVLTTSDYYELIDRIYYYKKQKSRRYKSNNKEIKYSLTEYLPNQLPKYIKNSVLFQKDLFDGDQSTLWGRVESIYDIKNYKAVDILLYIASKLNERIRMFRFPNFISEYDSHKYYGELIGYDQHRIYYKMVLENGVQFVNIDLGFNADVRECIKIIGEKKE